MMPWSLILRIAGPLMLAALLAWAVRWALEDARADGLSRGRAEVTAAWNAEKLQLAEQRRKEEFRAAERMLEVIHATEAQAQQARADAAIADAAAGRLRERVAALISAARRAAADPAPATAGPPAEDAAGVLADVLGRCIARVRLLATVADDRGTAGQACERSYDALTSTETTP